MKKINFKLGLAALIIVSFTACGSSGGGHDGAKNNVKTNKIDEQKLNTNTNTKDIIVTKSDQIALKASAGETIINTGVIERSIGAGKPIKNNQNDEPLVEDDVQDEDPFAWGMVAEGEKSLVINRGIIKTKGIQYSVLLHDQDRKGHPLYIEKGLGGTLMKASNGGSAINEKELSGDVMVGMLAEGKKSIATNDGLIKIKNAYYTEKGRPDTFFETGGMGMVSMDGGIVINNKEINGLLSTGMNASNSKAINGKYGIIDSTVATYHVENGNEPNYDSDGMEGDENSLIENYGVIKGQFRYGMALEDKESKGINYGTINMEYEAKKYQDISGSNYAVGMISYDSGEAINKKDIDLNGNHEIGMKADGGTNSSGKSIKSKVRNEGIINVNKTHSIGLLAASSGAYAVNEEHGKIYLNSTDGIGMLAEGPDSTVENRGEIYLSGESKDGKGNIKNTSKNIYEHEGTIQYGIDNNRNVAMEARDGGKIINKGKIIFKNNK